ncbi:MAG: S8 family serine peptidase [Myxacorys chilensis ATA2-1-KO14]|jgi:hypothetical protein|nr:S8 family serine peptidase [Myxacorys chilensis ATA2-1-KO14]
MKRDSYSDQQSRASFQPKSPQPAIAPTQLGQPVHHSSSTSDLGSNWLNKASSWVADKLQTAQNFVSSGDAIAPDQILPALKGTASPNQPLVGVIDSGFGANEHGSKMVEAIQKENPQAQIWKGDGVGTGKWSESLVEFVDTAKAGGHSRAVANLSFDLTEVHLDGSTSNRSRLTADEQSALAYARDNDVLVVASSGNQGSAMSALGQASQPSDNLIVVGAANGHDRASYSSYGKGLDLVAEVGSAGTSLAAAKVTGTIANIWSANSGLSDRQVSQILTATPTDLNKVGWDAETGSGLLNAKGAIDLARQTIPESIVFSGSQLVPQNSGLDQASSFRSRAWTSTDGAIASERPNWSWSDVGHAALDVAGFIPVVGTAADVANGALYLAEGNKTEAALSFAAAVPVVGDAIAAGAKAVKAAKAVNTGVQAARATTTAARGSETTRSVAASTTRSATREVGTVRGAANRGAGNVERGSGATRGSTSGGGRLRGDRATGRATNSQPPRGNSGGGGNKPPSPPTRNFTPSPDPEPIRRAPFQIQNRTVTHSPHVSDDALARGRYFTYTLRNANGEVRYVGRNSPRRIGDRGAQRVFRGRMGSRRDHGILKNHSDEITEIRIEGVQGNRAANSGAEDVLYSRHQIRNPEPIRYTSGGRKRERQLQGGANEGNRQLLNRTNVRSTRSSRLPRTRAVINAYSKDMRTKMI